MIRHNSVARRTISPDELKRLKLKIPQGAHPVRVLATEFAYLLGLDRLANWLTRIMRRFNEPKGRAQ